MRKLTSILLLICGASLGAAETWRWVDANGVTHYSDRQVPGAQRIVIAGASKPGSAVPPPPQTTQNTPAQSAPAFRPYTRCAITTPTNDQVFNAVNSVSAALELAPELQEEHRIQVVLNGSVVPSWPEGALSYTLANLNRGSYTLAARVVDASGRSVCLGSSISFHVRQPSILAPGRAAARRP